MTSTATDRVYGISSTVAVKAPCLAVSVGAPLPLVGLGAVGGYTPNPGDRILVKDQTDPTTNGIYNASAGAWQRSGDFKGIYDAVQGTLVLVYFPNGGATLFQLTTPNPVIGTTPLNFSSFLNPTNITYGLTPAEVLAGVAVVNSQYAPGYVDRYLTNNGPSTDMAPAFYAAIKQAKNQGVGIRWGATAPYYLMSPINATSSLTDRQYGMVFRCENGPEMGNFAPGPSIIANHTGHVFDLTGTIGAVFENVAIATGAANPQTAFFQARLQSALGPGHSGPSCGITRFMNCSTLGQFSKAAYYNYGAEDDQIVGCYFNNSYPGAAGKVVSFTGNNILGLTSTFQTVATGVAQSCIDHKIVGGEIYMQSADAAADCISIEQSDSVKIRDTWMYCGSGVPAATSTSTSAVGTVMTVGGVITGVFAVGAPILGTNVPAGTVISSFGTGSGGAGTYNITSLQPAIGWAATAVTAGGVGRSLIYVDQTNAPSNWLLASGITGEQTSVLQAYGVLFSDPGSARTPSACVVENCKFPNATAAIYAGANVTLDNFKLQAVTIPTGGGIYILGALQNSPDFVFGNETGPCTIVTVNKSSLVGAHENLTITNYVHPDIHDTGVTHKTWVPALGTVTQSGVFSVSDASCLYMGDQFMFDCVLNSTGQFTATGGQTITGLPIAAAHSSANVQICDTISGAFLANGFIAAGATSIQCQAFGPTGAGHSICISGRYKFA